MMFRAELQIPLSRGQNMNGYSLKMIGDQYHSRVIFIKPQN